MAEGRRRRALWEWGRLAVQRLLEASNRLRLPGPSVLPVAGAVVGLYAGLAAGIFANLVGLMTGLVFGVARLMQLEDAPAQAVNRLTRSLGEARWHPEFAIVGAPIILAALVLSKVIEPGGARDEVKKRLRILALLSAGALALYYPLVVLSSLNSAYGVTHEYSKYLVQLPFWAVLLVPALGGLIVGRMLRGRPETHGHGVPQVVLAVKRQTAVPAEGGLMKLIASSITIGSGGSAGREGPIVYGGAAFAGAVSTTLGFTRRELSILMASGAGAGIAASFNAPIAGAIFAMEIILRQFDLKVFTPIILASVTATLVGRGVMGPAPMLERIGYEMVTGWEVIAYALLGLLCGLVAYTFIRLLHQSERLFTGGFTGGLAGRVASFFGRRSVPMRAAIGGLLVGGLALINPTAWGTGHDFVNQAHERQLGVWFLILACAVKIVATSITLGSGGSGGTFFPATVMGAMAGGAFGEVLHDLFPTITASSGAYAMVGMGGAVAGLNRGALTGMMMVYELSGNYAVILPLMVTCTIASALCHTLIERKAKKLRTDEDLLVGVPVRQLTLPCSSLARDLPLRNAVEPLLQSGEGVLPVCGARGEVIGLLELDALREVWSEPERLGILTAGGLVRTVGVVEADQDLSAALELLERYDCDALPVTDGGAVLGVITRVAVRRFLYRQQLRLVGRDEHPVASTELGP